MDGTIGVGLIGYGLGGSSFHAPLIAAEPRLRLRAVVTSRAGQVERDHPGTRVVAGADELLADPEVELVVVTAPNAVHHSLAAAALRAGRHVVVDKPFALSTAEADDLIALAEAGDRRLSVFHNRRWDGDFRTVRRVLEAGALGEVATFVSRYDRFRPTPKGSWKEAAGPGSGLLWDLGPHLVDQAMVLFGPPRTVWADLDVQRPAVEAVDYVHLVLGYGRLRAVLHAGMLVRDPGPRFEVHGEGGSLVTWGLDQPEVRATLTGEVAGQELQGRLEGLADAHERFYAAMAAAVAGEGLVPVAPTDARATVAVIEHALASARDGRVVEA
jgi:scyllo-inositol 2-dehydrogenase (NADP+)